MAISNTIYSGIRDWMSSDALPLAGLRDRSGLIAVNTFVGHSIPFVRRSGFKVIELQRGFIRASMPISKNKNHMNTMYAGALFTLAEVPGGVIVLFDFAGRFVPILERFDIEYRSAAKTDVVVEASISETELERIESTMAVSHRARFALRCVMSDSSGRIVAEGTGHYQARHTR